MALPVRKPPIHSGILEFSSGKQRRGNNRVGKTAFLVIYVPEMRANFRSSDSCGRWQEETRG